MTLTTALAVAQQQISPFFEGGKWPHSGIYQAKNGQYLTGPIDSLPYKFAKRKWRWKEFVVQFKA